MNNEIDTHPFNGLFSRTTWVKPAPDRLKPIWIARDDVVAVASAGPYATHLHLASDRQP